jgi:nucleotidyltransferase/DNA polymerase involved in DNA repair
MQPSRALMTRMLCARFPHLGLISAWRRHPGLRGEPVVVGGRPELRLPVLGASAAAGAAGVRPGQQLRQAQQLCPAALFVALDEADMERLRAAVLSALWAHTPAVEVGDDEVFCDVSGSHALHPTESAWAAAIARALRVALGDEPPAVGVASSRFVARLAAARPRRIHRVRAGDEPSFVATQPVGVLPASPAVTGRLVALGLDCLGAVAGLSPADLERQFGPQGRLLHQYARGVDDRPLTPYTTPRTVGTRLVFEGMIADSEMLRQVAWRATRTLGTRLRDGALAAGDVRLVLEGEITEVGESRRTLPAPAGDADALWTAVQGLVAAVSPAGPVGAVRIELGGLRADTGRQMDLLRSDEARHDDVVRALDRIEDRFGAGTVRRPRLAVDPGDLPERRFTWDRLPSQVIAS